ncbi:Hypothetical predicted protein [Mytilus galloprovincialis]|uniref:Uncharacterized protein n=1 Tax=Mytilus galloprovincialis TaxID=29158 RepID=A0A8B6GVR1_MYTGA|nr:Hypothetical predicted protein [Mytilus galloprovincialis]
MASRPIGIEVLNDALSLSKSSSSCSTTSGTDSSVCEDHGEYLSSLPTKTSCWNIHCLESLGIFYNTTYHPSPLDILSIVNEELEIFGPLTDDQRILVEKIQKSVLLNTSMFDEDMHFKTKLVQKKKKNAAMFLPDLEENMKNLSNDPCLGTVKNFLLKVQLLISCQGAYLYGIRQTGAPEVMIVDILKEFCLMCDIVPIPGSAKKCSMKIHNVNVKSSSDVVLVPMMYRLNAFDKETACIVTFAEVEIVQGLQKTRETRSTPDGGASDVKPEPSIYQDVPPKFLGQHGGDLLIHKDIYGGNLSKGRMFRYLPGMICIGTRVIFTLLKIAGTHLREIMTMSKYDTIKTSSKATIYYSEPKDLLKKEDRDILVESFVRLNNINV